MEKEKSYDFSTVIKVRDYECDVQGVVNNANYQHYMEFTRHEYLESLGESFSRMHANGIDAFVTRVEIRYRHSLRGGDSFRSCLNMRKEGPKWVFYQDLYRVSDGVLMAEGQIDSVIVENGRLTRGEYFDKLVARKDGE
jgi:acyl-CoA thioester hydrolase